MDNIEKNTIEDFGNEWKAYNQNSLENKEHKKLFNNYFNIFPFDLIGKQSVGFDMGCGTGRWAMFIASKVKKLHCVEPSIVALNIAKKNLEDYNNCIFKNEDVILNSLKDNSQDFGYSLGVLHHIKDTKLGLEKCVQKLKKGAPFLIYLYYRFDNKPFWFQMIWKISNIIRLMISKLPFRIKLYITKLIALMIYWPFARISLILENLGIDVKNIPISSYRKTSFYTMKTDALDRFGTRIEHRFTKKEILNMMGEAGLINIKFSNSIPFWVAVGQKK